MIPPPIAAMDQQQRVAELQRWIDQQEIGQQVQSGNLTATEGRSRILAKAKEWEISPAKYGQIFKYYSGAISPDMEDTADRNATPVVESSTKDRFVSVAGIRVPSWVFGALAAWGLWWTFGR